MKTIRKRALAGSSNGAEATSVRRTVVQTCTPVSEDICSQVLTLHTQVDAVISRLDRRLINLIRPFYPYERLYDELYIFTYRSLWDLCKEELS